LRKKETTQMIKPAFIDPLMIRYGD